MNRREFLKLSGAGFLAMTFGGLNMSTDAAEKFLRIDFHAHAIFPSYIDALKRLNIDATEVKGFPLPKWSVENHLQFMSDAGIDFTVLSMATPHISDCKSARAINEDFAQL